MKVLVDTSAWSQLLRRAGGRDAHVAAEVEQLLRASRIVIIGPVRQELLSGIRTAAQYTELRDRLRALPNEALVTEDFERAAGMFNTCRAAGVQGAHTDFLICACAERLRTPIFTVDADFEAYARHLPIRLHVARGPA